MIPSLCNHYGNGCDFPYDISYALFTPSNPPSLIFIKKLVILKAPNGFLLLYITFICNEYHFKFNINKYKSNNLK